MRSAGMPVSHASSISLRAPRASGARTASRYASRTSARSSNAAAGLDVRSTGTSAAYPHGVAPSPDATAVARALRGGVATLDALAARLGRPARDELLWALDDAVARGWVVSSDAGDCGPDGLCGSSAPVVYR